MLCGILRAVTKYWHFQDFYSYRVQVTSWIVTGHGAFIGNRAPSLRMQPARLVRVFLQQQQQQAGGGATEQVGIPTPRTPGCFCTCTEMQHLSSLWLGCSHVARHSVVTHCFV